MFLLLVEERANNVYDSIVTTGKKSHNFSYLFVYEKKSIG